MNERQLAAALLAGGVGYALAVLSDALAHRRLGSVVCRLRGHRVWFVVEGCWCARCGRRLG